MYYDCNNKYQPFLSYLRIVAITYHITIEKAQAILYRRWHLSFTAELNTVERKERLVLTVCKHSSGCMCTQILEKYGIECSTDQLYMYIFKIWLYNPLTVLVLSLALWGYIMITTRVSYFTQYTMEQSTSMSHSFVWLANIVWCIRS